MAEKITADIRTCLSINDNRWMFRFLLRQYGIWSHFFGCMGYGKTGGAYTETAAITDETAMQIDSVVVRLKLMKPRVFIIFRQRYIENRTVFRLGKKQLTHKQVNELLTYAEQWIFDRLQEAANADDHCQR